MATAIIGCFTHDNLNTDSLPECIKAALERVIRSKHEYCVISDVFSEDVVQIEAGPNHVAFLTRSGRIARVSYSLKSEESTQKPPEATQPTATDPQIRNRTDVTRIDAFQYFDSPRRHATLSQAYWPLMDTDGSYSLSRRTRVSDTIDVPENLIQQVQAVLQGRDRAVIIRELQRSQLNVNAAINTLLNQDDSNLAEESDRASRIYPLLMVQEEIFRNLNPLNPPTPTVPTKTKPVNANPEYCSSVNIQWENIEFWKSNIAFISIGAMFSDLIALDANGCLHQWMWDTDYPYEPEDSDLPSHVSAKSVIHKMTKAKSLGINGVRVLMISCSFVRSNAVLENNKVITWIDESLWGVSQLEHNFKVGDDIKVKITKICCNNLFSVALLEDGTLWWWGVLPHEQRVKLMSAGLKKPKISDEDKTKIEIGSFVTYKSGSYIPPESLGFYFDHASLKMGRLSEGIVSYKSTAKFTLFSGEMDSDLDSTNKRNSKTTKKSRKRKHSATLPEETVQEDWNLSNVVFLYEQSNEVGQVVKIDKGHCLVEFEPKRRIFSKSKDVKKVCKLKYSRIVDIKDVKVIKHAPKKKHLPYCQSQPRLVEYSGEKIIGFHADVNGINMLTKLGTNEYVLDVVIPGVKLFESYKFNQKLAQFLFSGHDSLDIFLISNLLLIDFPAYGVLVFSLNGSRTFTMLQLPSFPQFSSFKVIDKANIKVIISGYTHLGRLSPDSLLMDNIDANSLFYKGQNILYFYAFLSFVSEVSFQRYHVDMICSKIRDLHQIMGTDAFRTLLVHKDFDQLTPFLYALKIRAYKFALRLYQMIQSYEDQELLLAATYNPHLHYGLNPLYLLCSNELCTYALTGLMHTSQDIYECKTCEVTGNLCLCTDCVLTCHLGHEVIKKDSCPSAFCDCWQKCICQSLVAGDTQARKSIFKMLVLESEIMSNIGSGSEHLLLYIVRTLSRQTRNMKEFKRAEKTKEPESEIVSRKDRRQNVLGFQIKHTKKLTNFLPFALKHIISTKEALVTLFVTKEKTAPNPDSESSQHIPYFLSTHHLIPTQSCGKLYDGFLFSLLTECEKSIISALHRTLKQHFSEDGFTFDECSSQGVLVNFIRSCIRLYIVITSTMSPYLLHESTKSSAITGEQFKVVYRLVSFFKRFPATTVMQLCKMSLSIISPIIYGCLTQKLNAHHLYTRMSDVNDFVSNFFSASQASINSIREKKPPPTHHIPNVIIDIDNIVSENRDNFDDSTYSDDEDDDNEDEDDNEDNEGVESNGSEYTLYTDDVDFEEDDETGSADFSQGPAFEVIRDDYPTVIEANIERAESPSSQQGNSNRNRHDAIHQAVSRRRLQSPYYLERVVRQASRQDQSNLNNYHWAVRASIGGGDNRSEGMSVIRTLTGETFAEGHSLLISNQTGLSRSFMIALKLISDICIYKRFFTHPEIVEKLFSPTLGQVLLWLYDICERIEGKLRFGMSSIVNAAPNLQSGHWDHDLTQGNSQNLQETGINHSRVRRRAEDRSFALSNKNRSEFLSNLVSLMRSYDNDHDGILPHLDLSSCKHIAYLLDGFSYFLSAFSSVLGNDESLIILGESSQILRRGQAVTISDPQRFFQRTSSTLSFSHFTNNLSPIEESIPLALHPSILTTASTKKSLFNTAEIEIGEAPLLNTFYNFSSFKLFSSESKDALINMLIRSRPSTLYVRWYHIFDIFAQIFAESVSIEPASIFREICRFETKESGFKTFIDRLRSTISNELVLDNLERPYDKLIVQTFKVLNQNFQRKELSRSSECVFSRIKVSFKNEPGEGSGVTRNYFAAMSEALKNMEKLPDLTAAFDIEQSGSRATTRRLSQMIPPEDFLMPSSTTPIADSIVNNAGRLLNRLASIQSPHERAFIQRGERSWNEAVANVRHRSTSTLSTTQRHRRHSQSYTEETSSITLDQVEEMVREPHTSFSKQTESRIRHIIKKRISKLVMSDIITTILDSLMQVSPDIIYTCLHDEECLISKVDSIKRLLQHSKEKYEITYGYIDTSVKPENSPLFFEPGKPGFYYPLNAKKTFFRLNAYKNVGRIIGLALLFNEMISMTFCRPLLKFLLDRQISFHDFAFYDPTQYESLRMLKLEGESLRKSSPDEHIPLHGLTFNIGTTDAEGKIHSVELMTGGSEVLVTSQNVDQYIQAYIEYLLIHSVKSELTSMREGLSEVFNTFPLRIFTAEDLRLVLHGTYNISIEQLKRMVVFSDETAGIGSEKINKFKNWFWEMIESFDEQQKSELLLFWTSSPLLSESQTTPRPNIVLKPPSEHLPTSNTCIMRLYLPVYTKKSTLKAKVTMAIKTKSFGFI